MSGTVPTFETERLFLRGVGIEDAASYEKHFVDYEVISELASAVPWPYPKGGVYEYVRSTIVPAQGNDRWV